MLYFGYWVEFCDCTFRLEVDISEDGVKVLLGGAEGVFLNFPATLSEGALCMNGRNVRQLGLCC